jgi:glycosidase
MKSQFFLEQLINENILDLAFNGNLTGPLFNFRQIVEETCNRGLAARTAWAMSNHDFPRIIDRVMGNAAQPEHAVLYAGMLACLPGGIVLFQGDELGLRQGDLKDIKNTDPLNLTQSYMGESDACRAGMPWLDGANDHLWLKPVEANKMLAPEIQGGLSDSPLSQIREILRLRADHPAFQGKDRPLFPNTNDPYVMAVIRQNAETQENMLCSFNFGEAPKRLQLRKGWDTLTDVLCHPLGVNFTSFADKQQSENAPYTIQCAPPPPKFGAVFNKLNRRSQLYASSSV